MDPNGPNKRQAARRELVRAYSGEKQRTRERKAKVTYSIELVLKGTRVVVFNGIHAPRDAGPARAGVSRQASAPARRCAHGHRRVLGPHCFYWQHPPSLLREFGTSLQQTAHTRRQQWPVSASAPQCVTQLMCVQPKRHLHAMKERLHVVIIIQAKQRVRT